MPALLGRALGSASVILARANAQTIHVAERRGLHRVAFACTIRSEPIGASSVGRDFWSLSSESRAVGAKTMDSPPCVLVQGRSAFPRIELRRIGARCC